MHELLMPSDFDAEASLQSKQMQVEKLDIDAPVDAILDLRPYINPATVTVTELCPVARCFALFRALGIRHMPVLSLDHHVVGIITRHEVSTDFSQDLF
jgi:CBS domain-containing protein